MILYIAEKPSLGRAIADVLPKPHRKGEGCIYAANGDVVSWCIGHLLEQVEPDAYDEKYKQWHLEHLPIIPQTWKLAPKKTTSKQLTVLKKLIKEADQLVHAGDPDREGQLLVDEVISYCKVSEQKRRATQRCLISDLNPEAVKKSLGRLLSNQEFIPLSTSALARSRADWLYGLNMTRLCTIQGKRAGYQGVLSVGRVQTPVLGLVVKRDQEIENFISKPFYEVWAILQTNEGDIFRAKWQPSEACQPYQDEDGRVLSEALASNVVKRIAQQIGTVINATNKRQKQAALLPYNLSSLQIDAAKRYGMTAQQVLDTCQALYEKYKVITYPRSDCRYLPNDHFSEGARVASAIANNLSPLKEAANQADFSIRSKAWNDKKVEAHHAIIPTQKKINATTLNKSETNIYELIARQYLMQFYPPFEFDERKLEVEIAGGLFLAQAKQERIAGWKSLLSNRTEKSDDLENQDIQIALPDLKKGDQVQCNKGEIQSKQTQPPKAFTDATLLSAMTGISRYVSNPEIRKVLKETDGLGTEATRAGILELLFRRSFLIRKGKAINATTAGKQLIGSLPQQAITPDMTARWESELEAISKKEGSYKVFMQALCEQLPELISQVQPDHFSALKGQGGFVKKGQRKSYPKRAKSSN